ncbi:helix-turn-helix transcriptional regulator [Rhodanobacter sp. AS-Z3]|uniref:helix-turn-helix domain-containing protein n=1 Tax=Rhodanobacter sp. AS-Z3 TaxID=3031330 RepID=UPI002479D93C|nr:helix-turn-helix transcriptional regulator [Rhodanobacter sp. AS-Z3]WEN13768.1 helix-turn-helix transcriptional regulator [Rhodanobacter sp. AS-Z3]
MAQSTHHPDYQAILTILRNLRERAAVTQIELAERVSNTQTFISKVERGERRLDIVEFVEICEALSLNPVTVLDEFLRLRPVRRKTRSKLAARK